MTSPGAAQPSLPPPGVYVIDPRASSVRFRARALFGLLPVSGSLDIEGGEITVAKELGDCAVYAVLRADSFATGLAGRDEHVRSADFLDTAAYPEIVYHGHRVHRSAEWTAVHGELTVRGTTRPVALTVDSAAVGGGTLTVHATATIDRYEFGVTGSKGLTGRRLAISLDVTAVRLTADGA